MIMAVLRAWRAHSGSTRAGWRLLMRPMSSEQASRPGWGVFWMIVTGVQFIGVTALVKLLGTRIPAPEAAFLRYVLGLVFLIPFLGAIRRIRMDRQTFGLFAARGVAHTIGVSLWFYAMARIPIADVTAINYLSPVYVTLGRRFSWASGWRCVGFWRWRQH